MTTYDMIQKRCKEIYQDQEGEHFRVVIPYTLGGKDPLDEVIVFKNQNGIPHWHYITCGFTELDKKTSDDPQTSGYGFELTFRLKCGTEEKAPVWPINLLQNLARYVFSSGNVFLHGEYIDCNGPIALSEETQITTLGFYTDPDFGEMDSDTGHMVFLEAIGMTHDEMEGLMCWNGNQFLTNLIQMIPLGVTDLSRDSMLENEKFRSIWEKGMDKDGSSTGELFMENIEFFFVEDHGHRIPVMKSIEYNVKAITMMLKKRLPFGKTLYVNSGKQVILFQMGEKPGYGMEEEDFAVVIFNEMMLDEFCSLFQMNGKHVMRTMPMLIEITD